MSVREAYSRQTDIDPPSSSENHIADFSRHSYVFAFWYHFSLKYIFSIFVHLVFRLEVLQDPGVVLRLLEVGEGDAGDQVDLLSQRLALVVVLEVLGVEFIILGVGGDRVVVVGAVQVVAAVGVPGVALEQLLAWEYISCLNLQQIILKSYQFPTW